MVLYSTIIIIIRLMFHNVMPNSTRGQSPMHEAQDKHDTKLQTKNQHCQPNLSSHNKSSDYRFLTGQVE